MISLFLTQNPLTRDTLASILSLEKKESGEISVYQKGKWVLLFSETHSLHELSLFGIDNYLPDFVYIPFLGTAIDVVHEIGDIILPNTFFSMDTRLETTEISETNKDDFLSDAHFLETYTLQKDYYVEDYGLSVGGIVVGNTPHPLLSQTPEKLMTAYEADIYLGESLSEAYELAKNALTPTTIICGIIQGKDPKHRKTEPHIHTLSNMITTIRLLEDAENEEKIS
jgi:hypothetical protein